MALENGEWILHGADWDSPDRIRSWQELSRICRCGRFFASL